MKPIKLSQLLNTSGLPQDPDITGISLDSRLVKPGDLFFACQGTKVHGREFIKDAIAKGALAILTDTGPENISASVPIFSAPDLNQKMGNIVSQFFGFPSKNLKIVGITGTNGKTSCSHFIAAALTQMNIPCGVIGTLGKGLYNDIKTSQLTTPDVITLHGTFADFVAQGAKNVAMEVSSHSLDQGRINGIEFEVGVFTNLTRDHLDYHHTMEAYGAAKKKLFEKSLTKIINADDPFGKELLKTFQHQNVFGYSTKEKYDESVIFADKVQLDFSGIHADVDTPWGKGELFAPLIGEFNVSNVLAVLTTLCVLKIPFNSVLNCLSHLSPVPGRMQTVTKKDKPLVIVDYAHTPDALEKVLIALRAHCNGKLYCLFGCGGDRDRGKRPLMAKIAEQYADHILITNDNPRTEDPSQIVADIMKGFTHPNKIIVEQDRSKAIRDIIQYAHPRDCVLIAGKGAETYQQIGEEKLPFSDVEKVRENLQK